MKWIVELGDMQKELEAIHAETGLPGLIAPAKRRIEQRLQHADYDGLSVVFRIDARQGLTQALRGPRHLVLRAQKALSG